MRRPSADSGSAVVIQGGCPATRSEGEQNPPTRFVPYVRNSGTETPQDPITIIGIHALVRECLGHFLSAECDVEVMTFSTIDEWQTQGQATQASLLVLCQCGRSKADSLKEVELLSEIGADGTLSGRHPL